MVARVRVSAETHVHLTLQSSSFPFVPSVCLCWQNKAQKTRGQSCQDEVINGKNGENTSGEAERIAYLRV